jgi:hypothetical protein
VVQSDPEVPLAFAMLLLLVLLLLSLLVLLVPLSPLEVPEQFPLLP